MGQTIPRIQALDILPSIIPYNAELFIKDIENEEISWKAYLTPFSADLWAILVVVAMFIAITLSAIEKYLSLGATGSSYKSFFINLMSNFWITFKANVGGAPSDVHDNNAYQIVLFDCLFIGSIVWISYQASLTSELSNIKLKLPFNDLETLLKSDYK